MVVFVIIEVHVKRSGGVTQYLRGLDGVVEAWSVYGSRDVIAKLEVKDNIELDQLIMERIQGHPEVKATSTHLVVESI